MFETSMGVTLRSLFEPDPARHPARLLGSTVIATATGAAHLGDSRSLLRELPPASINAVITSPPYALHFEKEYGNVDKEDYVAWFLPFAREIKRVLAQDGSFILNIGGSYNPRHSDALPVPLQAAHRPVRGTRVSPGAGVLLVQPRKAARPGRVGERAADQDQGFGGAHLVALAHPLAASRQPQRVDLVQ